MIRSESEYQEALKRLEEDRKVLERQRVAMKEVGLTDEGVEHAMMPALSFHEQLAEEVEYYERIRRGDIRPLSNLTDIGRLLIALRIASGMTQRELAARLDVSESGISRDEQNEYHGISIDRAQRILEALCIRVRVEVEERGVRTLRLPEPRVQTSALHRGARSGARDRTLP